METIKTICEKLIRDKKHKKYFYVNTYKRHLKDLKRFKTNDRFRFSEKYAQAYIMVLESLKHVKGELAGEDFILEDWQKALIGILFGWEWKNSKGQWVRRFDTAYNFISRKNGKSILASGVVISDIIIRPDKGGEVKIAATKKKQAQIVYNDIVGQYNYNKEFKKNIHSARGITTYLPNDTTIATLGNEASAAREDGLNVSLGIIDEYSAHGSRALFDIIESSMGARKQPLMFVITTAGFQLGSPSVAEYEYSIKILNGVIENDHYFAFIAAPMDVNGKYYKKFSDDALYASNPNIGISVSEDFLFKARNKARANPEALTSYLTKHENRFVSQSETFISLDDWKKNALKEEPDLREATDKIIGIDLSIKDDFTAKAIIYKITDDYYYLKTHFYIPEDNIINRGKQVRAPLDAWKEQGYITTTPGNTIDTDYIFNDIKDDLIIKKEKEHYNMNIELNYDPYKAKNLITKIENEIGFECSPTRQGYLTLSAPTKFLLDLTKSGKLKHDNNPVMNWMISNVTILTDSAGNIKPDKSNPDRKIDGVAAAVNCLEGYMEKIGQEEITEIIWI